MKHKDFALQALEHADIRSALFSRLDEKDYTEWAWDQIRPGGVPWPASGTIRGYSLMLAWRGKWKLIGREVGYNERRRQAWERLRAEFETLAQERPRIVHAPKPKAKPAHPLTDVHPNVLTRMMRRLFRRKA